MRLQAMSTEKIADPFPPAMVGRLVDSQKDSHHSEAK